MYVNIQIYRKMNMFIYLNVHIMCIYIYGSPLKFRGLGRVRCFVVTFSWEEVWSLQNHIVPPQSFYKTPGPDPSTKHIFGPGRGPLKKKEKAFGREFQAKIE